MLTKWEIETNYIFGYDDKIFDRNLQQIKYVYLFDLDYTLIKTKSGKKFPINKNDWEILHPNIISEFAGLDTTKRLVGIVSNQKGLKTIEQKNDWIYKIKQINKIIHIDFVFVSLTDDKYRKPLMGSFQFIKDKINGIEWDKLVEKQKIYYIGDAMGRETDFSDTDIKYALNNDLKFKSPEIFFKFNKEAGRYGSITYPQIEYFTEKEQTVLFDELKLIINTYKKIIIMTIGLPACGKTFLRKEIIKRFPQFAYSNNDDIQKHIQSKTLIKKISTDYDFIIDDNTNLDKSTRDIKLKQFDSYYKVGIWFNYDLELCQHLNWMRMYWFDEKLLPKVSYNTLKKKFDSNNISKEFDKFIIVSKVFQEMNINDKITYYF